MLDTTAENGRTVTFAHDEEWCSHPVSGAYIDGTYNINWAREFRYDGPRQRYLERKLDPAAFKSGTLTVLSQSWTDYDGDDVYGDYTVTPGNPSTVTQVDAREPGVWHQKGSDKQYFHNDHLGTLRRKTNSSGASSASPVFTAFGERVDSGSAERYGYAGAWGYQNATSGTTGDPYVSGFPFQHLGARYYDPATGRFLQRDPIGIAGGFNVYSYAGNGPTRFIDSSGAIPMDAGPSWDRNQKRWREAREKATKDRNRRENTRQVSIQEMQAELAHQQRKIRLSAFGIGIGVSWLFTPAIFGAGGWGIFSGVCGGSTGDPFVDDALDAGAEGIGLGSVHGPKLGGGILY